MEKAARIENSSIYFDNKMAKEEEMEKQENK